jgi:hypothetical protein
MNDGYCEKCGKIVIGPFDLEYFSVDVHGKPARYYRSYCKSCFKSFVKTLKVKSERK